MNRLFDRNHTILPRDTYLWESLPISLPDRLVSEQSWILTPKVSRVVLIAILIDERIGLNLTVVLDEKETRASRIVFHNKGSGDQGHPAPGASTSGTVAGGNGHKNGPKSECFDPCYHG